MNPWPEELARLRPRLLDFALRRLRNREQAEDAVQEALLAAIESRASFAGGSSVSTWVHGILRHKIVDTLRERRGEERVDPDVLASDAAAPHREHDRRQFLHALERALAAVPTGAAKAFFLREIMGLETEEVCRALAISSVNCGVRLHRAKARLRACPDLAGFAADAI